MRYREFMTEAEGKPVSRTKFLATLKAVLVHMTGGATYATTALQLNQGLCAEFAGNVVTEFGFRPYDRNANPRVTSTKWYWDDGGDLDLEKIQALGEPVPVDLLPRMDHQVRRELGSVHYWLVFNNRHYDAECLRGVEHFLDLPFFQRTIKWLRDGMPKEEIMSEAKLPLPALPKVGETPFWVLPLTNLTAQNKLGNWSTGGCFAFADTLSEVYKGQRWGVCSMDEEGEYPVEHAMARIAGVFYDFRGAWSDPLKSIKSKRKLYLRPASDPLVFWFEDEFLDDDDFAVLKHVLRTGSLPRQP